MLQFTLPLLVDQMLQFTLPLLVHLMLQITLPLLVHLLLQLLLHLMLQLQLSVPFLLLIPLPFIIWMSSTVLPKPPLNLKPAQGKKHLFSNIQQMRVQIMEEERAERSVHEKLLFQAQTKEIEERREYARKLFLKEENT